MSELRDRIGSSVARTRSGVEQVDENGDYIFRFELQQKPDELDLAEFYRQTIHDLLRVVRLYRKGEPVIIDEFAFFSDPESRFSVLKASVD